LTYYSDEDLPRSQFVHFSSHTTGQKEKRTTKENVDGRSTSSHDNKKYRTRSMEKQREIVFGFRKTAIPVKNYRIDRQTSHGLTLDGTRAFGVGGRAGNSLTMAPNAVYELDGRMDMGRKRIIFGRRGF
jgi:hypothetical protein